MTGAPPPRTEPKEPLPGARIKEGLVRLAGGLGFAKCGVAPAQRAPRADAFRQWLADGMHAQMDWLARDPERRSDPRLVLPGAASVIVLATNYFQGGQPGGSGWRISRYAWGRDYHDTLRDRLARLDAYLAAFGGRQRCYTDTGPVLERDHAARAGIGWQGKSTMLLDRELGTWFFLSVILTTLSLPPDEPAPNRCGSCVRCLDACPTRAITAPWQLDARRCLAFLTIENRGPIPEEFREALGSRIFGCDDCLDACPWNRFARASREASFTMPPQLARMTLAGFLDLDRDTFARLFRGSPVKRAKFEGFLRNVCVASGNSGDTSLIPRLQRLAREGPPLVAEHAAWAERKLRRQAGPPT